MKSRQAAGLVLALGVFFVVLALVLSGMPRDSARPAEGGGVPAGETREVGEAEAGTADDDRPGDSGSASAPADDRVRIRDIQGAAHASRFDGRRVADVHGIVTVATSRSFYMQDPLPDADEATSEGILVFVAGDPKVRVGDEVLVSGEVQEYYPGGYATGNLPITEIVKPSITVVSSGNALPSPTLLGVGGRVPPGQIIDDDSAGDALTGMFDPAEDGLDFYESLEGMLVQIDEAVAVGSTNDYGEIPIVIADAAYRDTRSSRGGVVIELDAYHPERIILDDALMAVPKVSTGDRFAARIVGVLDYNFGNFKLLNPKPWPAVVPGGLEPETTALEGSADLLKIATFNVLNLDPSDTEFEVLAAQIVDNLGAPDIIALQEIQDNNGETDDGTVDASLTYAALIAAIEAAGGPQYDWRDVAPADNQDGGAPGGNIRVGLLFRPDRVTFVDRGVAGPRDANEPVMGAAGVELTLSPGRVDPTNNAFFDSRKPLAGEFLFNGSTLFVVANHFNSKGGDTPLFGRVQPPDLASEAQRIEQAQVVNDFVDSILALDPDANVVVLGDLNDFQFSTAIADVLEADALTNLIWSLAPNERYTYIYDGNSQALDHILVSAHLASFSPLYDIVHVNAEFPAGSRVSDHDPAVALLYLAAP